MTLNFIPDGKSKNMSKIESKLDQKQIAGGKTDKAHDAAKEKKKQGGGDPFLSSWLRDQLYQKQYLLDSMLPQTEI